MLQIQLPINPVPASRPRVSRNGFSYYEQPYKGFKDEIKELLAEKYNGEPIDYEVVVTITCWAAAPQNSKLPSPRPDVDNYAKGVLDGLNKLVLKDDSLVKQLVITKHWAAKDEPGRIHVYIERA